MKVIYAFPARAERGLKLHMEYPGITVKPGNWCRGLPERREVYGKYGGNDSQYKRAYEILW